VTDPDVAAVRAVMRDRAARAAARLRRETPPDAAQGAPGPAQAPPPVPSRPLTGQIRLDGFEAPVTIATDAAGVPHVLATARADLYRAQGFLHYSERCWQIETAARAGRGELAALIGPTALASDAFMHRLRLPARVDAAAARAPRGVQQVMTWYAEGARAALAVVPSTAEHAALGRTPRSRDGAEALRDATAILLLFGLTLQHDWLLDLLRAALAPQDTPDVRQTAPSARQVLAAAQARLGRPVSVGSGSNAWAVAPDRCDQGGPVLAADPHLQHQLPGPWMAMHLTGPGVDVVGATVPGMPDVMSGHNGQVAWASTFAPARGTRLTLERLSDDGEAVARLTGAEPTQHQQHEIKVAGGPAVLIESASVSSGMLLGLDLAGADGSRYDLAIESGWWAEPYPQPVLGGVNEAASAAELTAVLAGWRSFPMAVVYADRTGQVGTVQVGLRGLDQAGPGLRCGWLHGQEIQPLVSRHRVDNGGPVVVAANAAPPGGEPGHWDAPLRAGRVRELLGEGTAICFEQSVRAQLDVWSPLAGRFLPRLDGVAGYLADDDAGQLRALRKWHGYMYRDLAEPTVFVAWLREVASAAAAADGATSRFFVESKAWLTEWGLDLLAGWLASRAGTGPGQREIAVTFQAALTAVRDRLGPDPAGWLWGRCHLARYRHALDGHPGWTAEPVELALPGADDTICRGDGNPGPRTGPSLRLVIDLGRPDDSVWAMPVGNSGVPASPHSHDLVDGWTRGRYSRLPFSPAAVRRATAHQLSIVPFESAEPSSATPGGIV
jgi:penicillin amidase